MRFLAGTRPARPTLRPAESRPQLTGLAQGETHYDELERQLALGQVIKVPTITL